MHRRFTGAHARDRPSTDHTVENILIPEDQRGKRFHHLGRRQVEAHKTIPEISRQLLLAIVLLHHRDRRLNVHIRLNKEGTECRRGWSRITTLSLGHNFKPWHADDARTARPVAFLRKTSSSWTFRPPTHLLLYLWSMLNYFTSPMGDPMLSERCPLLPPPAMP